MHILSLRLVEKEVVGVQQMTLRVVRAMMLTLRLELGVT